MANHTSLRFPTALLLSTLLTMGVARADTTTPRSLSTLGVAVSEDFNTLASTGTGSLAANTPIGVGFLETGSNANSTYTAGTGSSNTGDTYSFGASASAERALGGLLSGSLNPTLGFRFRNDTGSTITAIDISYTGEQWRLGTVARVDRLDFQYSLSATALSGPGFTDFNSLDFTAPVTTGTVGALNGNVAPNRTAISASITGLSLASGAEIWLRWTDIDATSSDDGLAIDDFSITPQGSASNTPPTITYNPNAGSTINLPAGLFGASVTSTIVLTPSGGSGSGSAATTTFHSCSLTGAGASAFASPTGVPMSFVGNTTTAQNLGLACTIAGSSASALLSCTETQGGNAPATRSWPLNCPAATPDTPPTVSSTVPSAGAGGVSANSNITINFSEAVTTSAGWFALNCSSSGNVSYVESGTGAQRILDPNVNLASGETCTGTIEASLVSDLDGTPDLMSDDFAFSFTVASSGGGTTTVVFSAPAANQLNVRPGADLTVIFSQSVTVSGAWYSISCTISGTHPGTHTSDAATTTRYRIDPSTDFALGDVCTWTLLSSAISPALQSGDVVRTFTVGDYYSGLNVTSSSALRTSLHNLIDAHNAGTYTQAWTILEIADAAPDHHGQIIDVYRNRRFNKISDRAGTGTGITYNREHTWPNSLGFPTNAPGPYTDTHMLYLSDTQWNADRGNKPYLNCPNSGATSCGERFTENNAFYAGGTGTNSGVYPGTSNWVNSSQYETWNLRKGDVARAVLYMDVRYEGDSGEPQLTLGESTSTSGQMASLSALIAWHNADPPDAAERLRNDVVYAFQNNRNPYIDNPAYVDCIYNNICSGAPTPPNLGYLPTLGSTINLSGSSTLGGAATASITVTPAGGSGTGAAATSTLNNCSITGAGFAAVTPSSLNFVGNTITAQSLNLSCTVAAGIQNASLSCQETLGAAAPVSRMWNLSCPAASANTPPSLSFSPSSGSSLTLSGGSALGSQAGSSIVATPSGGAGSGASATTLLDSCTLSGVGASQFASVLGLSLRFEGASTAPQSLPLSCSRGAQAVSATLSCQVRPASAASSSVNFNVNCPAAAAGTGDLISLSETGVAYQQSFDSLQSGSFVSYLPPGWRFSESGTGADTTYRASSGSDNAGDTYAYGPGSCERAFGSLLTSSVTSRIGACFVNNTGRVLNTLRIAYTGEQWRRGAASGSDLLRFEYLLNPASPSVSDGAGSWINVGALDFSNPVATGTANSSVNGNDAANRATRNADMSGLALAPDQTLCIRWLDTDLAAGSDHGLAVDDFSLIAEPAPAPGACQGLCVSDVSVTEGNAGSTQAVFNVTLSSPAPVGGVQFDARTAVESASNFDADYDYLELADISIAAGQSSTTVNVSVRGDSKPEASERFRLVINNVRGTSAGDVVGIGTIVTDDPFELWQIQTEGDRTPLDGSIVSTIGNVVTAVDSNGFFMQSPPARRDGNALTSDAVFVFTGSTPAVVIGNSVDVTGTAQERFCSTQINATGAGNGFSVTGSTTPIAALSFDGNRPSANPGNPSCASHPDAETANFECFEHMLVSVQNGFVQGGSQRFAGLFSPPSIPSANPSDPAAEALVLAGGARHLRSPGFVYPGFNAALGYPDYSSADAAQVARVAEVPIYGGAPQVFELDPDALDLSANRVFFGGERFSATGVLAYEFDDFELWPTELTITQSPSYPRTAPAPAADELSIASLNLLRFFGANGTGLTTPTRCDGSTGTYDSYSTGASGVAEVTRRRNKLARYIIDAMKAPDVLGVQEAENLAGLQALANELNARNASLGYSAYLVSGNDRGGINVGFLLRDGAAGATARISGITVEQLAFNERLSVDNSCLHDRPPLRLRASFGATAFTVYNNHTRSLLGIDEASSDGARTRVKRLEQALSIRALVSTEITAEPTRPIVLIGDYNAFQFSDGWVDPIGVIRGVNRPALLASPATEPPALQLLDGVELIDPQERYSYLFDHAAQALDHAMLNVSAQALYRGLSFVRNNVDAPAHSFALAESACAGIDIQTGAGVTNANFGAAACTEGLSDHEGLVLRLAGNTPQLSIPATASSLEGHSGVSTVSVPVSLTGTFPTGVSTLRVPYRVVGGSATLNVDFQIPAGGAFADLSVSQNPANFSLELTGDVVPEADESIELELGQAIDLASGQPAPVALNPNARRIVITILNDDTQNSVVPLRIGSADRGSSGGDYLSQSFAGSARVFRSMIEVPSAIERLTVEVFDADFGAGGVNDALDVPAGANFNAAAQASYRLLAPNGTLVATLLGSSSSPLGADNQWTPMPSVSAPTRGLYVLEVSVPTGTVDSNGYRIRARALPFERGGGATTDLPIFAQSFASLGHPNSALVGVSSETFYPLVNEGCSVRTRSFDFDAGTTSQSSIALNAPHGFSQLFADAALSGDGEWNSLDSNSFVQSSHAQGYGIWSAAVSIEGGGGSANQATVYFAPTRGESGSTPPASNPAQAAYRIYQAVNGGAPRKPSMRQQLFHVSGANPPSPGNPGVYRVSIQLRNGGEYPISFAAPERVVRSLVPFGGVVSYQGAAQPSQGSVLSEPALGDAGAIVWNPGLVAAGDTAELTYVVRVAPQLSGVTPVTGNANDQSGTQAWYQDETGTVTGFGPLCALSLDSAGTALPTPVTLASMRSTRVAERVKVQFSLATQVGVAAYRIHAGDGDFRTPVDHLFASSGDTLSPVEVEREVVMTAPSFYLEVLDIDGSQQWFGPFAVGAAEGRRPDLPAIDWPSIGLEHEQARMRERAQRSAVQDRLSIEVAKSGPVRLSADAILELAPGLAGAALSSLELRDEQGLVALAIDSVDTNFGAGDVLWFLGRAQDRESAGDSKAWLYGKARRYRLQRGQARLMQSHQASGTGTPVRGFLRREWKEAQTLYHFASPSVDPFASHRLLANPQSPARQRYQFELKEQLPGVISITAEVWGGSDLAGVEDHRVALLHEGVERASVGFDGLQAASLSFQLPQATAPVKVDLHVPGNHGPSFDLVLVDRLRADYPARMVAEQGRFQSTLAQIRAQRERLFADGMGDVPRSEPITQVAISGFAQSSSVRAWVIDRTQAWMLPELAQGQERIFSLPAEASAMAQLVAFEEAQTSPATLKPWLADQDLLDAPHELLVLAHPQFLEGLAPYLSARRAQGVQVKLVNVESVYQRFGEGGPDPEAIKRYLIQARAQMGVRSVLLVGGDTYDARGDLGSGSISFLPTPYRPLHPVLRFGASDAWYADLDDDGAPELALGRWPVRSQAELSHVIEKTLRGAGNQRALFIADDRDSADAFSFADASERILKSWAPELASRAYLDQLTPAQARQVLLERVAANDRYLHYFGHSGPTTWSYPAPGILGPNEIFSGVLSNSEPNILVQWGCWNSYHVLPQYNTLAHAWLLGPRGAAAVIGAAGITDASNDALLAQLFAEHLKTAPDLGTALMRAKRALHALRPNAVDVLMGTSLLGDPTLR